MYKQDRGGLHMARYGIYCLSLWICLSAPMKASSHLFRLFGGSSPCQGTVQIRSQDAWLPVCNGSWSNNLTAVLCRDLRCGKPEAQTGSLQTQPVNQTFLTLTCSDNDSLKNCKISPMESDCSEPVSVYCTGSYDLRLTDGVSRCSGRVEVFLDGVWGSVCDDGWDALDAHVTCQQLGCGSALQALGASHFGPGPSTIHWEDVKCNGTERHLWDCPSSTRHDCTDREHAGVICTEDKAFRVSDGPHNCSGRIEVLMDGAWGTVCDSQWFEEDFQMFCKLLGCGPYVRKTIYNHSLSTYMGIICKNTASLLDCRVYHKNNNICQQAGALGVICGSFYNTEKEAGQAVSPVNPGFPLLAMMICVTMAALLLVAVITFSLVIWRMKRLQSN
uniref:SRCR domain-containing protein n=1 Tax=Leptobrachium leishanense TaxID=445787 RepID=A0A8C5PNC7_9ANUR